MLHNDYGPRGAEEEHDPKELWVDLSETDALAETAQNTQTRRAPMASHNDPLGSWTGTPTMPALKTTDETTDENEAEEETPAPEIPTQDADDL